MTSGDAAALMAVPGPVVPAGRGAHRQQQAPVGCQVHVMGRHRDRRRGHGPGAEADGGAEEAAPALHAADDTAAEPAATPASEPAATADAGTTAPAEPEPAAPTATTAAPGAAHDEPYEPAITEAIFVIPPDFDDNDEGGRA